MADNFLAEIRIFAGNFAPQGWAKCDGQLLPIIQNTALFSLLGTTYGGDGKSTFGLPDLRGRASMHTGMGPGLTERHLGNSGGTEIVTLSQSQLPQHAHTLFSMSAAGTGATLQGSVLAGSAEDTYAPAGNRTLTAMSGNAIGAAGGGSAHNNMQPFLVLNFIIALQGIFPPRP